MNTPTSPAVLSPPTASSPPRGLSGQGWQHCVLCCYLVAASWELPGHHGASMKWENKKPCFLILTLGCVFANEQDFEHSDALITAMDLQRSGSHLSSCLAHMHGDVELSQWRVGNATLRVTRTFRPTFLPFWDPYFGERETKLSLSLIAYGLHTSG